MTNGTIQIRHQSPRGHYVADATIIWCADDRMRGLLSVFVAEMGFRHPDCIVVLGGAKALASSDPLNGDREFLIDQIKKSVLLHQSRQVFLMLHEDCAAYGGSAAFASLEEERSRLFEDLETAAAAVRAVVPIAVALVYADFEGVTASGNLRIAA